MLRLDLVTTDATGLVDVSPAPRSRPLPVDTSIDTTVDVSGGVPRMLTELAPATSMPHR